MREIITQLQPGREGGRQGSRERGERGQGQRRRGCGGIARGQKGLGRSGWKTPRDGLEGWGAPTKHNQIPRGLGDWIVGTWGQLETAGHRAMVGVCSMQPTAASFQWPGVPHSSPPPQLAPNLFPFKGRRAPAELEGGEGVIWAHDGGQRVMERQLAPEISADSQEFEQAVRAVVSAGQRLGGSSHFLGRAPD